jgi:hypothetical protein
MAVRPNKPPAMIMGVIPPSPPSGLIMLKSITWPDAYGNSKVTELVTPSVAVDMAIQFHSGLAISTILHSESSLVGKGGGMCDFRESSVSSFKAGMIETATGGSVFCC